MKKRFFIFLSLVYLLMSSEAFCIPKIKKESKKISPIPEIIEPRIARVKLNAQFGFNVLSGSAIVSGFQLGRLVSDKSSFYLGPEVNFMLFAPGSILNLLLGGWIEKQWFSDPKKTIDLGVFAGAGFADRLSQFKTTNFVMFFELGYTQRVDDTLSIRGVIQPGIFDRKIFTLLSFNAQFVFL